MLEQIKIDFDEQNMDGALPMVVNSKKKFMNGPSNNQRTYQRSKFEVPVKQQGFGFVQDDSPEDEKLNTQIFSKP